VEQVVGVVEERERGALAEAFDHRFQQREVRELVARAAEEQHRDVHLREVRGAFGPGLARRVQREADEHEPRDARQRLGRLRLRGHSSAERPPAGEQRQPGQLLRGRGDGGAHRGVRERRRVGPLRAAFDVAEVEAQRRDAALGEPARETLHRRMAHPGARAVREHEHRGRAGRHVQQRRDRPVAGDRQLEGLHVHRRKVSALISCR
jgi:hypothetical protein